MPVYLARALRADPKINGFFRLNAFTGLQEVNLTGPYGDEKITNKGRQYIVHHKILLQSCHCTPVVTGLSNPMPLGKAKGTTLKP